MYTYSYEVIKIDCLFGRFATKTSSVDTFRVTYNQLELLIILEFRNSSNICYLLLSKYLFYESINRKFKEF